MYKRASELSEGDKIIFRSGDAEVVRTITKVSVKDNGDIRIVHKLDPEGKPASIFTVGLADFIETVAVE